MRYEYKSRIRFSECDENKKLSLPGLVNYFQDTCTFQGDDLGVGHDRVLSLGGVWMITYWQIDIERMPGMSEHVAFATWPYDFNGFFGTRNFTMEDEDGGIIARANSVWVLMDAAAQRPMKVPAEITAAYEIDQKLEMEYTPRKIKVMKETDAHITYADEYVIEQHHLDTNHHVNNGQYIMMAAQYLPADFAIGRMRAEYKIQARLGDRVCPAIAKTDGTVQVALNNEAGKPYAVIEFAQRCE